jgi:hypothetical protein
VAIAAIDAVVADVVLVAERNRLLRRERSAVRRQRLVERDPYHAGGEQRRDENELQAEDYRRVEDLGHELRSRFIRAVGASCHRSKIKPPFRFPS